MRARTRIIAPLAFALALTAACGESGSSGSDAGSSSGSNASGEACAPVKGDKLVVLEDDKNLQNADNVLPAVNAAVAKAQPALLPALDAISAKLTTDDLVELNAAVDVQRKSAEDVAAAWVKDSGVTAGLQKGSGALVVGATSTFTESAIVGNIYGDVLKAAGFDVTVQDAGGNREAYLKALEEGKQFQVFPEYAATLAEFINHAKNGPDAPSVASPDIDATMAALTPLAEGVGLTLGTP